MNNLFSVAGKTVVVTGGSRGIGLMIAQTFVENGAKVYISSRKAEVCDAVAAKLSEIGSCHSVPADLSTEEGRNELVEAIKANEDELHVLVNNAGASWGAPFASHPESGYDKVLGINVKSIFFLTQELLPLLEKGAKKHDPARVINVGSIDGIKISPMDNLPYGTSKAAVHHLTKGLAIKLGGKNITVNAIAPGPFESKMTKTLLDSFQEQIERSCPLGRIGQPQDMGGIAVFLSSAAGSYLNGAVIPVDGGIHLT
ncbi:MAG: SDR family oxidoreductase [Bacteroidota bacterium]